MGLNNEVLISASEKDEEKFVETSVTENSATNNVSNPPKNQLTFMKKDDPFKQRGFLLLGILLVLAAIFIVIINQNSPSKKSIKTSNTKSNSIKNNVYESEQYYHDNGRISSKVF